MIHLVCSPRMANSRTLNVVSTMILCSIRTALRHLACLTGNDVSFKSVPDEKSLRRADPLVMQPARTPPPPEFATQQSLDDDGKPELLLVNCQAYFFFFLEQPSLPTMMTTREPTTQRTTMKMMTMISQCLRDRHHLLQIQTRTRMIQTIFQCRKDRHRLMPD